MLGGRFAELYRRAECGCGWTDERAFPARETGTCSSRSIALLKVLQYADDEMVRRLVSRLTDRAREGLDGSPVRQPCRYPRE